MGYDREQYKADIEAKRWCQFVPKHERLVLSRLISTIINCGHSVSINDSEEWVVVKSKDKALCRSMLGHAEEEFLRAYTDEGTSLGTFHLIYNNGSDQDPMIVISNYSDNHYCNAIIDDLTARYGV
jgi:hypothetical protein